MTTTQTRPTGRLILAAGVIPLAATGAGAILLALWRDDLPSRLARHWSGGAADGFSSFAGILSLLAGLGAVFAVVTTVLALSTRDAATGRVVAGIGAGTTAFTAAVIVGSVGRQRGLTDAAAATMPAWLIAVALCIGAAAGLLAVAAIPSWAADPGFPEGVAVDPVSLSQGEVATWSRTVSGGVLPLVIVGVPTAALVVVAIVTQLWWLLVFVVVAMALAALVGSVRVVVDQRGIRVRGALGWPCYHVALDDIEQADVVDVNALRDFGGFGFRLSVRGPLKGSTGVVLRSGRALRVLTRGGKSQLVVVDDASTGAGLLNGLLTRTAQ